MKIVIINILASFGAFVLILFLLGSLGVGNFALIYHGQNNKTNKLQYAALANSLEMDRQMKCLKNKE